MAEARAARGGTVLIGALIIDSLGNGLFLPLSLVFFLKLTTVPLAELGALASAATLVTLPVPIWAGSLADKFGALPLVVAAQLMQAAGYLAYSWVKAPWSIFAAGSPSWTVAASWLSWRWSGSSGNLAQPLKWRLLGAYVPSVAAAGQVLSPAQGPARPPDACAQGVGRACAGAASCAGSLGTRRCSPWCPSDARDSSARSGRPRSRPHS